MLGGIALIKRTAEEGIESFGKGLESLCAKMGEAAPQDPPDFRADGRKARYLRKSARFLGWAKASIGDIAAWSYNFSAFKTALESNFQAAKRRSEEHAGEFARPASEALHQRRGADSRPSSIRRGNSKSNVSAIPGKNGAGRSGRARKCRLCGSVGHLKRRRKPGEAQRCLNQRRSNDDAWACIVGELVEEIEQEAADNFESPSANPANEHLRRAE